jgi:hypothetical protein
MKRKIPGRLTTLSRQREEVQEVLELLTACKSWMLWYGDRKTAEGIMHSVRQIAQFPLTDMKEAIQEYARPTELFGEEERFGESDVVRWGKIYVLHRYIFDVPEKGAGCPPYFGGFVGQSNQWPGMMAPLAFDAVTGKIILKYQSGGYRGAGFRAVEEFDHFLKVYGLRTLFEKGP